MNHTEQELQNQEQEASKDLNNQQENNTPEQEGGDSSDASQEAEQPSEELPTEEQEIASLKNQNAELKDKYIRLYAEFDNYKKRTVKEKLEFMKTAAQDMMAALLPIIDDFDRAKKNAEDDANNEVFSEGIQLVYQKFNHTLQQKGLKAMDTNGESFDPELHEAISEIPVTDDMMKGKIIDTIEKGYFLNDKIIRHAKVVVGK